MKWARMPYHQSREAVPPPPSDWSVHRIDQVYETVSKGRLYATKECIEHGRVPVLDQSENGIIGYHNDDAGVRASEARPVVTFANHTCEMRWVEYPFSVIQNVFPMVGRDGVCETRYLYFATKGRVWLEEYKGHYPEYRRAWIPLPPLPEQRRIAAILGALDDKIELNRKMNQTLEEMAQAIFKSWFIDFDGHDDLVESELGMVPRGWEVGPLDEIIEVIGGGTPKRSEPRYWGGAVPWFSVQDAPSLSDVFVLDTKEHITDAGLAGSSARLVPAGTTIISARGTVGKLAVTGQPMAFNQSCYGIAPSGGYTSEFVYFLLRSVVSHLQRSAHGSVFDTITRATFQTAMVVQPPVERTRAFADSARPLLKRIAANGRESATLIDLRDTLLPKLISGELRVPEAEAIVEDAT